MWKQMHRTARILALSVIFGTGLGACNIDKRVHGVVDIEVTAGKKLLDPSTAKFTVEGGSEDLKLMHVSSPSAVVTRMVNAKGETIAMNEGVPIKAGQKVRFGPGEAYGIELDRVNRIPRGTYKIEMIFVFSNGDRQFATAPYIVPDGAEEI